MFEALASEPLVLIGFDLPDDEFILLPKLPVGPRWLAVSAQTANIESRHRRLVRLVKSCVEKVRVGLEHWLVL